MLELRLGTIAAYARYSSDKQNESSIEDQLRKLRDFAAARGRQIAPSHVMTDEAISGASLSRPGFERLMQLVRRREVEVVLVEDTSRLSRDNADALTLFKQFAFYGVQLVAICDGIDSGAKGAKLAYSVKALMSDLYLEDLRDKTLRGMEGRAHAGLATGGRLLGYRTVETPGADPRRPAGFRIEIDEQGAKIVRRIFEMWVAGESRGEIARKLNRAGVSSPRDFTRHRRKHGWSPASIRVILSNERYRGLLRFNERRWVKVPGSNKRVPRRNPAEQVITQDRPDLAIIDDETWVRAQVRQVEVRLRYTVTADGQLKGTMAKRANVHPFSGLLHCQCGSPMTIHGGYAKRRYYACVSGRRARCKYHTSIREDVVGRCVMDELVSLMADEKTDAQLRRRITTELGAWSVDEARTTHRRERAAELEKKLSKIVGALNDDKCTATVAQAIRALEIELAAAREAVSLADRAQAGPPVIRSKAQVLVRLGEIRDQLETAPLQGREALRQLCVRGTIGLVWNADGKHSIEFEIVPAVLIVKSPAFFAMNDSKVRVRVAVTLC